MITVPICLLSTRAFCRYLAKQAGQNGDAMTFEIGWKLFPHPVNLSDSLVGTFMGIFLFVASMFAFVMSVCSHLERFSHRKKLPYRLGESARQGELAPGPFPMELNPE
jgi:hypothetical protein